VGLVAYASVPGGARQRAYSLIIKVGLFFALLSIPFNVLTGSAGATALLELPRLTFPDWLGGVTLGGEATAESMVHATGRALRLMALLLFVAAFNVGVDHYRLLRLTPSALKQMGVVVTVAVLLIPQAVGQARAVAEAQRLRGRRVRGLRSLAGLTVPVLAGALERSIQRAESLDARGFGSPAPSAQRANRWVALLSVGGLGLVACGGFSYFYYGGSPLPATAAMAAGVALIAFAVRARGWGVISSRSCQGPWIQTDVLVAGCSFLSVVLLVGIRALGAGDVTYNPYPHVAMPALHPLGALAILLLLAPAAATIALNGKRRENEDD
jgi:energy-coupling factor transport system permease protein